MVMASKKRGEPQPSPRCDVANSSSTQVRAVDQPPAESFVNTDHQLPHSLIPPIPPIPPLMGDRSHRTAARRHL